MDFQQRKSLDMWLADIGYYRKHIANDETCIFRAISEQIYNTQTYHEEVRKACVEYALRHADEFRPLVDNWPEYIFKLVNHSVICGLVEMQISSKKYKRDFILFDCFTFKITNVTRNGFEDQFLLCKMKDNHYDAIVKDTYIENASYCQALLYKVLYEKVFEVEDLDNTVQSMLYPETNSDSESTKDKDSLSPFPFKVAKALDPEQYRNVEYDAWNQSRKDLRSKEWYLGGSDFKVGTKCMLSSENRMLACYIQDMKLESKEFCLVYVISTAEKLKVKRADLQPLPDAKPWPLPYAINRNNRRTKLPWAEHKENIKYSYKSNMQQNMNCSTSENSTNVSCDKNYSLEIDTNKKISIEICDKQISVENRNKLLSAHKEGCPLIKSAPKQVPETNMDNTNNNIVSQTNNNYANNNIDEWNTRPNNCALQPMWFDNIWEPTEEQPSNQLVEYNYCPPENSFVPVAQVGMPLQNIPLVIPAKSLSPNGSDLPFHDLYSLRYYFNIGVESVRQNYEQMWLPIQSSPPPFVLPEMCCPYSNVPNQQMCMSAQYNLYQHNSNFTVYSQVIKGSYNMNNNNHNIPNYNTCNNYYGPNYVIDSPPPAIPPVFGDMFVPQMESPPFVGPMIMSPPPVSIPYCPSGYLAPPPSPFGIPPSMPLLGEFFKF